MRRIAFALLFAACGSDGNTPQPDASTTTPDAATQPDAAPDAPPAIRSDGFIVLAEEAVDGADVDAVFAANTPFGPPIDSNGMCTSYGALPDEGYSAGTITITGTTVPITMTPEGTAPGVSYQEGGTIPDDVFAPGATISVQASGGDLAAFNATVTAPAAFTGYTPPTTISRTTGTMLNWTAAPGGRTWVLMIAEDVFRIVVCDVPDTGSYMLTPANLALIPPGATGTQGLQMLVGRAGTTEVTTANGTVLLLAIDSVGSEATLTP